MLVRLACTSPSGTWRSCSRTAPREESAARLLAGSLPCRARCCSTPASSQARFSGFRASCSTRIWPRGFALSSTQACMAAIRASRPMKSICSARMPRSRLRSVAGLVAAIGGPPRPLPMSPRSESAARRWLLAGPEGGRGACREGACVEVRTGVRGDRPQNLKPHPVGCQDAAGVRAQLHPPLPAGVRRRALPDYNRPASRGVRRRLIPAFALRRSPMKHLAAALASLAVALVLLLPAGAADADKNAGQQLAHDVFFTLKDRTPEAKQKLVDSCKKYLTGHPGCEAFSAGVVAEDLTGPLNDREFDVALHILFKDKAAHDQYVDSER